MFLLQTLNRQEEPLENTLQDVMKGDSDKIIDQHQIMVFDQIDRIKWQFEHDFQKP